MDNQLPPTFPITARKVWLRLSTPVLLALALTTLILFAPVWAAQPQPAPDNSAGLAHWLKVTAVQAAGSLTLTKSANPALTVNQGELITYTLFLTNNTTDNLNFLTVQDQLPANTSCDPTFNSQISPVFDSGGGRWLGGCSGSAVIWNYVNIADTNPGASFAPGEAVTLTFRVQVGQPLRNRIDIITNDTYQALSGSPDYSVAGTDIITHLVLAPEWDIAKTVTPTQTVQPGQNLTYTLTVTNVGDLATSGPFTITDELPQHTNFVTATPPVTVAGNTVTWVQTDSLAIGQAFSVTMVVSVTRPLTDAIQIINNNYQVSGGSVYSDAAGAPVAVTVNAPVTLEVQKTAPATVQAGDLLTYTITITNAAASSSNADGLVFTDTLPANILYVDHGFSGSATGNLATGGPVVTWTLQSPDPLPIGQAVELTLTVRVQSPLTNGTVITNSLYGPTTTNTLFVEPPTPVTTTVNSAPIITLTKTVAPQTALRGQPITYTITVTNSGNETAVNLPFTDAVQAPDFTPAQATWALTVPGKNLAGTVGVVSYTLAMTTGNTPGEFPNYVTTTVRGIPIEIGPVATVTVRGDVNLQISKARLGSGEVIVGDAITYTLSITNASAETADAVVTDTFTNAAVLTYSVAYPGASCGLSGGDVRCTIPALNGSTVITVVLDSSDSISGVVTNTAIITPGTPGQGDTDPLDNRDTVTTPVRYPIADLSLSKSRLGSGDVIAGGSITYTLTLTNSGPDTVDAVVTDTFTGTVTSISSSTSQGDICNDAASPIVCNFNGFTGTETITVVLQTASSFSGTLTNTAVISFATGLTAVETDPANNVTDPPVETPVRYPIADLSLSKSRLGSGEVLAGGSITYTLTLTNSGPDTVDAVVTDTFTGTVTSISSGTSQGDICNDAASPIICNFNGFTGTETITVVLQTASSFSGTLTNTARIAAAVANTVDPPANNSDTVTTPVRQLSADLQIAKTGPAVSVAGDPVTYTVTITNPGDAVNVVVTDTFSYGSYQSATATGGGLCSSSAGGPVTCSFASFSGVASITVVLNTPTSLTPRGLTNQAVITATQPNAIDPNPANNSAQADTTVRPRRADLQINKELVGGGPVIAGQPVTFTLTITNAGPDAVSATLGDSATAAAVTGINIIAPADWLCSGLSNHSVTCNNASFELGTQTITVVLTTSAAYLGTLNNSANIGVGSGAIEEDSSNNFDDANVTVASVSTPLLTITKTANPTDSSTVSPGDTIRYTLTVSNVGAGPASGVVITDDLTGVGGVAYVSGSGSSNGSFSESGGQVTASQASLGVGQALTATWEVTVTASTSGTVLSNAANAASANTPVITSNLVAHMVITQPTPEPTTLFLPIIIKDCCYANLVIDSFTVNTASNPPTVEVVVKNIGLGPTETGFWVDLYVNPNPLPVSLLNAANPGDRRWQRLRTNVDQGIAWEITTPLAAGDSITLTETSAQIDATQTKWTGLPAGTHNFYTFADSFDADDNRYVQVNEGSDANELDNQAGPQTGALSPAGAGPLDVASTPAKVTPLRRDAGQ